MIYERFLPWVFPYVLGGEPEEIRDLARTLCDERPDYLAGGSSFAVVVRPTYMLYLSSASFRRLPDGVQARCESTEQGRGPLPGGAQRS